MNTLLSFGHGYSARALAPHLLNSGWRVIGTTRSADKASALAETGVEPTIWPGEDLAPAIEAATHILVSAGPTEAGDPVLTDCSSTIAKANLKWLGYLSTTGVYGDHKGGWVDEDTPLRPSTKRGLWRVAAEDAWRNLAGDHGLPLHIFRLAGIYGPGRGPFSKVRNGTARRIIKKGQVFSRIHVKDIAQVLLRSIQKPQPGSVYNVCDNEAAPPEDVIAYAARLLGLPVPEAIDIEDAEMTPMARSFYAESKRVRNNLIREELGVDLIYPNYRVGLEALLALERSRSREDNP